MKKVFRRLVSLVVVAIIMVAGTVSAFASEVDTAEMEIISPDAEVEIMPLDAQHWSDTIRSGSSADIYPVMNSYVGFNKIFTAQSQRASVPASGQITGNVKLTLYKPNGDVRGSWTISPNGSVREQYFLPSSGTYRLHIENNSNISITIVCQWI